MKLRLWFYGAMDVQKLVGIFKSLCSRLSWRLGSAHCFWREWILPLPGVPSWLMSFVCSWSESCCTSQGIAIVMSTQNWLEMHMRRISGFLFCCYFCLPFYSGFRARFESTELDMGKNVDLTMVLFPEKCKHCWGDCVCVREREMMLQREKEGGTDLQHSMGPKVLINILENSFCRCLKYLFPSWSVTKRSFLGISAGSKKS